MSSSMYPPPPYTCDIGDRVMSNVPAISEMKYPICVVPTSCPVRKPIIHSASPSSAKLVFTLTHQNIIYIRLGISMTSGYGDANAYHICILLYCKQTTGVSRPVHRPANDYPRLRLHSPWCQGAPKYREKGRCKLIKKQMMKTNSSTRNEDSETASNKVS